MNPESPDPFLGRRIEHYRILDEIGRGQWGVVYRARDEDLRCDVAVKVVAPRTFADLVSREAARREVLTLARLNHPAVVVIHRWIQEPDADCVVMEFVQGESLEQKLRGGALPEAEAVRLGIEMARGLAAVHDAGVIHRDLKPGNLRVRPDGLLKIVDFGLAKHAPAADEPGGSETGSEGDAGTAPYVAPEVWRGEPAGEASDLYAAGVILYEMATGVHPFIGFPGPIPHAAIHGLPPTPRERNPAISAEFEEVILRLLRKDPAQRFPSAKALADSLEAIHARRQGGTRRPRLRWPVVAVVASAALLMAATGWWIFRGRARIEHALAVLVPENARGDAEQNHVAVAVTDALISGFGRVPRLRVTSLTSVLPYMPPARRKPIRQIAQELDVDRVVEGSMLVFDGRLRFTLRLYSTSVLLTGNREERLLWSGTLDGDRGDVFDLQSNAADSIARVIGLQLEAQGPGVTSADPAANEEYYQGRYEWNRRSDESIRSALGHFERAVARDSNFALAYSGLADAWATAGIGGMIPPAEAAPPAKRAAQRALALNPDLSEAWVSLGNIQQNFDWNWKGAGRAYRKAIELNPNNAHAHHWYANHLALRGQFDPAIAEIRRAQELDPLSLPVNIGAGAFHYYARRYEEALVEYERVLDLDSTSALLNRAMAATLIRLGREADAARAIQRWLDHSYPGELATRAAEAHRAGGLAGMVRVLIGALEVRRAEGHYGPATHIAELYCLLPDRERALLWLALAHEEHDTQLNRLRVDPIFDPLRGDARFADLMRRVGLESRPRCGGAPR